MYPRWKHGRHEWALLCGCHRPTLIRLSGSLATQPCLASYTRPRPQLDDPTHLHRCIQMCTPINRSHNGNNKILIFVQCYGHIDHCFTMRGPPPSHCGSNSQATCQVTPGSQWSRMTWNIWSLVLPQCGGRQLIKMLGVQLQTQLRSRPDYAIKMRTGIASLYHSVGWLNFTSDVTAQSSYQQHSSHTMTTTSTAILYSHS